MRFARAGAKPFARKPYVEDATPWNKLVPQHSDSDDDSDDSSSNFNVNSLMQKNYNNADGLEGSSSDESDSEDFDSNVIKSEQNETKPKKASDFNMVNNDSETSSDEEDSDESENAADDGPHQFLDIEAEEKEESEESSEEEEEGDNSDDSSLSDEVADNKIKENTNISENFTMIKSDSDDTDDSSDNEMSKDDVKEDVKVNLENDEVELAAGRKEGSADVEEILNASGKWIVTSLSASPDKSISKKRMSQTSNKEKSSVSPVKSKPLKISSGENVTGKAKSLSPVKSDVLDKSPNKNEKFNKTSDKVCQNCNEKGHAKFNCPAAGKEKKCPLCTEIGHTRHECPNQKNKRNIGERNERSPFCYNCRKAGHTSRDCRNKSNDRNFSQGRCFNCQQTGHISRECPNNKSNDRTSSRVKCYNCQETGHTMRECTKQSKYRWFPQEKCFTCNESGHRSFECPQKTTSDKPQDAQNCYNCQKPGHISRDCPEKTGESECFKCHEKGHKSVNCPNKKVRMNQHRLTTGEVGEIDQLKQDMNKDGMPEEEIQSTVKLVARRMEKQRQHQTRKQNNLVCYACQGSGHSFVQCPNKKTKGENICYICGSTEHYSRNCDKKGKSERTQEFAGATCFRCNKVGHLARQCPEGIVCQGCGESGHIKRHCPQLSGQKKAFGTKRKFHDEEEQDGSSPVKKPKVFGKITKFEDEEEEQVSSPTKSKKPKVVSI